MTAQDGLAGVTCGGAFTSGFETPVDLSAKAGRIISLLFQPAVYEQFVAPTPTSPGSPNDLSDLTLHYTPTTDYFDLFEPNDSLARARQVSLPFNTIPVLRFTELSTPDDVDFFRFKAKAGPGDRRRDPEQPDRHGAGPLSTARAAHCWRPTTTAGRDRCRGSGSGSRWTANTRLPSRASRTSSSTAAVKEESAATCSASWSSRLRHRRRVAPPGPRGPAGRAPARCGDGDGVAVGRHCP